MLVCLLSIEVACATATLSTCSLAWSAVSARVRIRAGTLNYVKRIGENWVALRAG